ncbi:MAG: Lrp/AsnC ligand binding domain-containing protein [Thermoplasmatota archaeon]
MPLVIGFVFIKTRAKMEVKAYRQLITLEDIKELTPLFGDYDLIAKVEAQDFKMLSGVVVERIRKVPGVVETITLAGVDI